MPQRKQEIDPRSLLPLKPDFFHILLALSEQDLHGYGILKVVEETTGGKIVLEPSPLYRRLKKLLDSGVIVEVGKRQVSESNDERRRYYRLTSLGRKVLAAEAARLVEIAGMKHVRALATTAGEGR
jgi:DNA-binding PadR family transcriptional regulator